jgi:hypothetical protein
MTGWRVFAIATLASAMTLAGCGDPPAEQTATSSSPGKPAEGAKPASLGSHMVSAVSASKNSTAISVHFSLDKPPAVSTPLPVEIAIVPHQKFESVRAHFESQEGLTMPMGEEFGPVKDADPEKALSHQLMLLPTREGMFMVTVMVDTVGDDGNVVRIFSIPVIVGPAKAAEAPAPASAEPAKQ